MPPISRLLEKISRQPESYKKKQDYVFGDALGAGSFGVVRQATTVKDNEEVAIKIILKRALKGNEDLVMEEIKMLQKLHHPHIIAFKDWFESKDKFYIVTQLATGGELFDEIISRGKFTEHDAWKCIDDILDAVAYLHRKNIVHRDLKPENLLYTTPAENSDLVLADFGIAKSLTSAQELLTKSAGSFGYAAPEVLRGAGHGMPCDIWSLGVICYTVLSGYSPFRSESIPDFLQEVSPGYQVVFHKKYWKDVSDGAKQFIARMLQIDPAERPTAEELLSDPWIKSKASDHHTTDLLPQIREGFNARNKFLFAIEAVKLSNRIKALGLEKENESHSDDEDAFFSGTSPPADGARFHEVVMAAARSKDIIRQDDEKHRRTDSTD